MYRWNAIEPIPRRAVEGRLNKDREMSLTLGHHPRACQEARLHRLGKESRWDSTVEAQARGAVGDTAG